MLKVKEIPKNERPYERLINNGREFLSTDELLAILIKSGYKDSSSKIIATRIISQLKSISELKKIKYEDLIKIKGIGQAKACNILAAIELGNRINVQNAKEEETIIKKSLDVFELFKGTFDDKEQEYFYCLYLDNRKKVKKKKLLFIGTINYSVVHPREIFKEAYMVGAVSIIIVHNHPTGNVNPSVQDIETTKKIVQVGRLLGITVDDHVIIGQNNYYSFFENGMFD
jgi:DNA repair protein RadC